MPECSGSCATLCQNHIVSRQPSVLDTLSENYEKRKIVQQELRKQQLMEKGDNGALTTTEAMELAGYRIQDGLEKLAKLHDGCICYMA